MTAPVLPPIPRNSTELEEMLADPKQSADILKTRDILRDWIKAYGEAQQAPGTDLHRMVAEEAQKQLADLLRDDPRAENIKRLNLDPQTSPVGMRTSHRQGSAYNAKAAGAALDGRFGTITDYLTAIWHQNQTPEAVGHQQFIRNAFGSTVPADGGFLVPEAFRANLLQVAMEEAIVRPRATVLPMETARINIPMIDTTTHSGSVIGGMVAYWTDEAAALTDSSIKFGRVVLDAKKLTGLSLVPSELLTDSLISFSALIEAQWPRALAWFEDAAFITGSGAGEPLGFLGNPAAIAVSKQTGQSAATILVENINRMYARMLPSSLNRAVWLCSPGCIPELFEMALSVGTGGSPVMVANVAAGPPVTIYGRPLIVTEKLSALGTQGDLAFVDLSYYLVGDRQTMTASSSVDYRFANDQTAFRILQRVDGRPWILSALTPANGSDTLSPFVELATRA